MSRRKGLWIIGRHKGLPFEYMDRVPMEHLEKLVSGWSERNTRVIPNDEEWIVQSPEKKIKRTSNKVSSAPLWWWKNLLSSPLGGGKLVPLPVSSEWAGEGWMYIRQLTLTL